MRVTKDCEFGMRIDGPDGYWCITDKEAIQLAKDLLMVCGKPEPTAAKVLTFDESIIGHLIYEGRLLVYCEHSVWEVFVDVQGMLRQKEISVGVVECIRRESDQPVFSGMSLDEIQKGAEKLTEFSGTDCIERLATLIANLAARVKEQREPTQVVITHGEGVLAKCSNCGYEG